jgi:hypothetical protein
MEHTRYIWPEDMESLGRYHNKMEGTSPFVNNVTYLGFTFDRRITWKLHIETTVIQK